MTTPTPPKRPRGRPKTLAPENRRRGVIISISPAELAAFLAATGCTSPTDAVRVAVAKMNKTA